MCVVSKRLHTYAYNKNILYICATRGGAGARARGHARGGARARPVDKMTFLPKYLKI